MSSGGALFCFIPFAPFLNLYFLTSVWRFYVSSSFQRVYASSKTKKKKNLCPFSISDEQRGTHALPCSRSFSRALCTSGVVSRLNRRRGPLSETDGRELEGAPRAVGFICTEATRVGV